MKVDYFCNSVLLFRRVQGKGPSLTRGVTICIWIHLSVEAFRTRQRYGPLWSRTQLLTILRDGLPFSQTTRRGAGVGEGGGTAHASPCNRSGSAPLYNVRRSSAVDRRAVRRRTRQLSKRRGHIVSTSFSFTLNRFCWLSTLNRQIFFFSADVNETRGLYFHFCYLTYFHKFRRIQSFEIKIIDAFVEYDINDRP